MSRTVRRRFWLESILSAASAVLFVVTLFWRDWIEILFRVEPDAGTGSLEWLIVAVTAIVAATSFILARSEWLRSGSRKGSIGENVSG
jgi:hypothetical protein